MTDESAIVGLTKAQLHEAVAQYLGQAFGYPVTVKYLQSHPSRVGIQYIFETTVYVPGGREQKVA